MRDAKFSAIREKLRQAANRLGAPGQPTPEALARELVRFKQGMSNKEFINLVQAAIVEEFKGSMAIHNRGFFERVITNLQKDLSAKHTSELPSFQSERKLDKSTRESPLAKRAKRWYDKVVKSLHGNPPKSGVYAHELFLGPEELAEFLAEKGVSLEKAIADINPQEDQTELKKAKAVAFLPNREYERAKTTLLKLLFLGRDSNFTGLFFSGNDKRFELGFSAWWKKKTKKLPLPIRINFLLETLTELIRDVYEGYATPSAPGEENLYEVKWETIYKEAVDEAINFISQNVFSGSETDSSLSSSSSQFYKAKGEIQEVHTSWFMKTIPANSVFNIFDRLYELPLKAKKNGLRIDKMYLYKYLLNAFNQNSISISKIPSQEIKAVLAYYYLEVLTEIPKEEKNLQALGRESLKDINKSIETLLVLLSNIDSTTQTSKPYSTLTSQHQITMKMMDAAASIEMWVTALKKMKIPAHNSQENLKKELTSFKRLRRLFYHKFAELLFSVVLYNSRHSFLIEKEKASSTISKSITQFSENVISREDLKHLKETKEFYIDGLHWLYVALLDNVDSIFTSIKEATSEIKEDLEKSNLSTYYFEDAKDQIKSFFIFLKNFRIENDLLETILYPLELKGVSKSTSMHKEIKKSVWSKISSFDRQNLETIVAELTSQLMNLYVQVKDIEEEIKREEEEAKKLNEQLKKEEEEQAMPPITDEDIARWEEEMSLEELGEELSEEFKEVEKKIKEGKAEKERQAREAERPDVTKASLFIEEIDKILSLEIPRAFTKSHIDENVLDYFKGQLKDAAKNAIAVSGGHADVKNWLKNRLKQFQYEWPFEDERKRVFEAVKEIFSQYAEGASQENVDQKALGRITPPPISKRPLFNKKEPPEPLVDTSHRPPITLREYTKRLKEIGKIGKQLILGEVDPEVAKRKISAKVFALKERIKGINPDSKLAADLDTITQKMYNNFDNKTRAIMKDQGDYIRTIILPELAKLFIIPENRHYYAMPEMLEQADEGDNDRGQNEPEEFDESVIKATTSMIIKEERRIISDPEEYQKLTDELIYAIPEKGLNYVKEQLASIELSNSEELTEEERVLFDSITETFLSRFTDISAAMSSEELYFAVLKAAARHFYNEEEKSVWISE